MNSDNERDGRTPISGACLCGSVQFEARTPTSFCAHCHCSICRRSHGAGFVTWFSVPRDQFRFISGESVLARYQSSEHGSRSFCSRCGSSLFFETTNHPNRIDIVLANVTTPIDRGPQLHVHFDDRADWVVVQDELPRLGGETGLEPIS